MRVLATRAADYTGSDDPGYLAERLEEFRRAGADEAVRILLDRDPAARARLDDPDDVAWLLEELMAAGNGEAVRILLARDPAGHVSLGPPRDIARLLRALRSAGAGAAVASLAARAAAGARLEDPHGTARLLEELHAAGPQAGDAIQAFLARDPAGQVLIAPGQARGVTRLLEALRAAGASQTAQALAERAADAGMFQLRQAPAGYRFGREPDGSPAPPWRWAEPLLPAAPVTKRRRRGAARAGRSAGGPAPG